jgi:predicted AAA+ superfamily ATPase
VIAMIERQGHLAALRSLMRQFPVVAILGARQVGKTTLARQLFEAARGTKTFLDLEQPQDLALLDDLGTAGEHLRGFVVVDEVQRRPELFPLLRVLVDRSRGPRFLVLGSAGAELLRQSSESLAGRIAHYTLPGLSLEEVGPERSTELWVRGGFPRSFLAASSASVRWRREFVTTFIERDIPAFGVRIPPPALRRLWMMLAHVHGNVLNVSELGRSMAVTDHTVRHYVDVLASTFMVRVLPPWFENVAKRQVKSPKAYVRDSGLLHALLGIEDFRQLGGHPKMGASFEGFCVEQVVARLGARDEDCYFWRAHSGAELDLLVVRGGRKHGFEVKHTATPRVTPSMRSALEDLKLDSLTIVHAGDREWTWSKRPLVRALPVRRIPRMRRAP